jgi:hypothetical protein
MKPGRHAYLPFWTAVVALSAGCSDEGYVERTPDTLAVEEIAGDFLDYYQELLQLSNQYSSHPDSFQAAVDSLPGSHLTDEQWEAWTAPYREQPALLADRLEEVMAELRGR